MESVKIRQHLNIQKIKCQSCFYRTCGLWKIHLDWKHFERVRWSWLTIVGQK